jgi:hypothetical protein
MKVGRRTNGKDYAEERKTLETYYEYYLDNPEEIKAFINMIAFNSDTFDVDQYLKESGLTIASSSIVTV